MGYTAVVSTWSGGVEGVEVFTSDELAFTSYYKLWAELGCHTDEDIEMWRECKGDKEGYYIVPTVIVKGKE